MKYCDECNGTGFLIKPENPAEGEQIAYPCACRKEQDTVILLRKRLKTANIPEKYWNCTIGKYYDTAFFQRTGTIKEANAKSLKYLQHIIDVPDDFLKSCDVLWLWGRQPAAGLKSLATAFIIKLLEKGYKAKFFLMQKFLDVFTDFENKHEYFQSLEKIDIFFIDKAFMRSACVAKEYTLVHFYNWFLDALNNNKRFIFTSKISIEEIDQMFEPCKNVLLTPDRTFSLEFQGSFLTSTKQKAPWEK